MNLRLRRKLTIEFVLLFLFLYFAGGVVAIFVFVNQLDRSLDNELKDLSREIIPAVELLNGRPTLKNWTQRAGARHDQLLSSIQVYDTQAKLLEEVGPRGIGNLLNGVRQLPPSINVRSFYSPIEENGRNIGFLQVQVSTRQRDEALVSIIFVMLVFAPFLALAVAICGSWFSGNAVRPVEETMALLRQFVIDAAHEINTPISVIEASVQTCEELFDEKHIDKEILQIMMRASGRMKALGESLIFLAKMESPNYELIAEDLSLKQILVPVIAECGQLAKAKKIELNYQEVPNVLLKGNSEALERLFLNIIANAIRYTNSGAVEISFATEKASDKVAVKVRDSGCGIPATSLPHIFDRFYRVDPSRSRGMGGYGLGLSIVKAIADRHGATLEVESKESAGTVFTVILKTSPQPPANNQLKGKTN